MADTKKDTHKAELDEEYEKFKEENKQKNCSGGYLFNFLGHHIHITELFPMLLFLTALIMLLLLVSGAAEIESVVFAGMAMGSSGLALVAFWNYKDLSTTADMALQMEDLVDKFGGALDKQASLNEDLKKEVDDLEERNKGIAEETKKIQQQLGILNENGEKIRGVLEGYKGFLNSQNKLQEFTEKEQEVRRNLLLLEEGFSITRGTNRIKTSLRRIYGRYRHFDKETGTYVDHINVAKDENGEYVDKNFAKFMSKVSKELKDNPEVKKNLDDTLVTMDADGDGKLTVWEFMLQVDRAVDKWADKERDAIVERKMKETEEKKKAKLGEVKN